MALKSGATAEATVTVTINYVVFFLPSTAVVVVVYGVTVVTIIM